MSKRKQKIIFLDIDGPMIPMRACKLPGQPHIMELFDPVAVSLINDLCKTYKWQIVLHTSWIRIQGGKKTYEHCILQGINPEHFHEDAWCDEKEFWRYTRIAKWLDAHPETTEYVILDDAPYEEDVYNKYPHPKDITHHLILVDYVEGLRYSQYRDIYLRDKEPSDE